MFRCSQPKRIYNAYSRRTSKSKFSPNPAGGLYTVIQWCSGIISGFLEIWKILFSKSGFKWKLLRNLYPVISGFWEFRKFCWFHGYISADINPWTSVVLSVPSSVAKLVRMTPPRAIERSLSRIWISIVWPSASLPSGWFEGIWSNYPPSQPLAS